MRQPLSRTQEPLLDANTFASNDETEASFVKFARAIATFVPSQTASAIHIVLHIPEQPTRSRPDGPGPLRNLSQLQHFAAAGGNVTDILDNVNTARLSRALQTSTVTTYTSHLRLVYAFCKMLNAQPLPAERRTVLRFMALFNNASTIRGALAAWRQVHLR